MVGAVNPTPLFELITMLLPLQELEPWTNRLTPIYKQPIDECVSADRNDVQIHIRRHLSLCHFGFCSTTFNHEVNEHLACHANKRAYE
jgi:hypothetical protein